LPKKVIGSAKWAAREYVRARLQIQERLTSQIAQARSKKNQPRGVGVIIKHVICACDARRREATWPAVTSGCWGPFVISKERRDEFFALARRQSDRANQIFEEDAAVPLAPRNN